MKNSVEFISVIKDFLEKGNNHEKIFFDNIGKVEENSKKNGMILGQSFLGHNSFLISPQDYKKKVDLVSNNWKEVKIKLDELIVLLEKM